MRELKWIMEARQVSGSEHGWLRRLPALVVLVGFVVLGGSVLLRTPCLGVADNGDYWRVMRAAGIGHLEPFRRPGAFVHCEYETFEAELLSGLSSAAVMAWTAKHLSWGLVPAAGELDLRQVGVLYLLLTAALAGWGLARAAPALLVGLWLYVLADPVYLLFFNSFYADPALLVAGFGTTVWFLAPGLPESRRRSLRIAAAGVLAFLVLLGGASKMQYVVFPLAAGIALASLALAAGGRAEPTGGRREALRTRRFPSLLAVVGVLAVVLPWHFFHGPAPRFLQVNNYHAVFAGILQVTEEPDRVLEALGVSPAHRDLPRRDVWAGRVPPDHPVHAELTDLSRWRLLSLYLEEPAAVRATVDRLEESLAAAQTHRRGTFPRGAGHARWAQYAPPWGFSRVRAWTIGRRPAVVWWVPAAALAWILVASARRRWGGAEAAALFLVTFALGELVVVVVGDGFVALEQHLLGARFALDLLLVLVLYQALGGLAGRIRRSRAGPERVIDSAAGPAVNR